MVDGGVRAGMGRRWHLRVGSVHAWAAARRRNERVLLQ